MTDTFTASNGIELWVNENGWVERRNSTELGTCRWDTISGLNVKGPALVWDALREFFLLERDKELGRWRWPENPNYVVYPGPDGLMHRVVYEPTLDVASRRGDGQSDEHGDAARAYNATHPKPEPCPWHDARVGEVWVLKIQTGPTVDETACTVVEKGDALMFEDPVDEMYISVTGEILDARRVWPEVVSDV